LVSRRRKPLAETRGVFAAVVDALLDDGIAVRFRASGRSMSPAVRDGEMVVVAPVDPAEVGVGEVVYCRAQRGPLAHRVVAIEARSDGSRRFTLCGDAAPEPDRPIDAPAVRGRVIGVERAGELVSLDVVGGWLGRTALVAALGLRRALRAAALRALAGVQAAAAHSPR
jgi:hypothetical protein